MTLFHYIVAAHFMPKYCPSVKLYKHKMRGIDGNGKPIEFSKEDKLAIKKGLRQLFHDLDKG